MGPAAMVNLVVVHPDHNPVEGADPRHRRRIVPSGAVALVQCELTCGFKRCFRSCSHSRPGETQAPSWILLGSSRRHLPAALFSAGKSMLSPTRRGSRIRGSGARPTIWPPFTLADARGDALVRGDPPPRGGERQEPNPAVTATRGGTLRLEADRAPDEAERAALEALAPDLERNLRPTPAPSPPPARVRAPSSRRPRRRRGRPRPPAPRRARRTGAPARCAPPRPPVPPGG